MLAHSHARTHSHTQTHSVIDSAVAHVVYVLRVALSVCGTLLLSFRGHPLQTCLVYLPPPFFSPSSSFPFSLPLSSCLLSMLFILIHASGKGINRAAHKDARGCQSCCWVYSLIRLMRPPLSLPLPPYLALLIQFTADVPVAFAFDCLRTGQHRGANYNLSCC